MNWKGAYEIATVSLLVSSTAVAILAFIVLTLAWALSVAAGLSEQRVMVFAWKTILACGTAYLAVLLADRVNQSLRLRRASPLYSTVRLRRMYLAYGAGATLWIFLLVRGSHPLVFVGFFLCLLRLTKVAEDEEQTLWEIYYRDLGRSRAIDINIDNNVDICRRTSDGVEL